MPGEYSSPHQIANEGVESPSYLCRTFLHGKLMSDVGPPSVVQCAAFLCFSSNVIGSLLRTPSFTLPGDMFPNVDRIGSLAEVKDSFLSFQVCCLSLADEVMG